MLFVWTLQALAAVLGGTQSLHTNSMDEALWLPTEKSVRVALRTQQIIAHESGIADSVDPLAGSYLIEALTDKICEESLKYIEKIDEMGGALRAIENGFIQGEIQDAAYRYQQLVEREEELVIGMNSFQIEEQLDMEGLRVDPMIEQNQKDKLAGIRRGRDNFRVNELLLRIEQEAKQNQSNLMPLFIESVENSITLGEICNVLRKVWGEYQQPTWL